MTISGIDIAVAACLAKRPHATYEQIAGELLISQSTAFKSVKRLQVAGLVHHTERQTNKLAFLEFVQHGLRYVCPLMLGPIRLGVPTAHAGPDLSKLIEFGDDAYVWSSREGTVRGRAVEPLVPRASEIAVRSPEMYAILALLDAVRGGRARERNLGMEALRRLIGFAPMPKFAW
ncbi:MAG: hypothetical protein NTU67_12470 [Gemmatimonadetes bacterium]|nr:hypothetical protein [Gemmatimonadota bacterium]